MPSVKNLVSYQSGFGRLEMHLLDDEDEADDVSVDNSSPRPERRMPVLKNHSAESGNQQEQPKSAGNDAAAVYMSNYSKDICRRGCAVILTNIVISVVVILVVIATSLSLGWYSLMKLKPGPVIDKSIKAFNIPNHRASRMQDALDQAINDLRNAYRSQRGKRSVFNEDPSQFEIQETDSRHDLFTGVNHRHKRSSADRIPYSTLSRRRYKMTLVYLARGYGDHNIFTEQRLNDIHKIEMDIMGFKNFTDFCYINYPMAANDPNLRMYRDCAPLNSLLTYFYPSISPDRKIHYDSLGSQLDDINRTLTFAMTRESFFWYVDDAISATNRRSRLLRSEAHFGSPLPGMLTT